MFPIKRKREGADGTPLIQKKNVAQNPLQLEPTIEELQPVQSVLDQKLKEWVNVQWTQIMDDDIPPEQKIARLHALEFHAGMNKITEFMTNTKKQFVLDFIKWLQYKDPTDPRNEAFVRETERQLGELGATVRNGPLDVEGKEEWLCNFIDKKVKYDRAILKLRLGPHSTHNWDLHDAWLYYKYILRGEKLPQNDFLSDFDEYFYHKMNPPTLPDVKPEPREEEFVPGHHPPGKLPQDPAMGAEEHQQQEQAREEAQEENPVGAKAVSQEPVPDAGAAQINDTLNRLIDVVRENRPRKRARPAEGEDESKRQKPEVKQEPMEAEPTGPAEVQAAPQPPPLPERPHPPEAQSPPSLEQPASQSDSVPPPPPSKPQRTAEEIEMRKRLNVAYTNYRKHKKDDQGEALKQEYYGLLREYEKGKKEGKELIKGPKREKPKDQKKGKQNEPPIIPPPETEKEKKELTKLKTNAQDRLSKIAKSRPDAQEEVKAVRQQIANASNNVEVLNTIDAIPLFEQKLENKDKLKKALDAVNIPPEVKDQAVAEFSAVPLPEATMDTANQIVNTLMEQKREKTMEVDKPEESDSAKDKEQKMEMDRLDLSNIGNLLAAQKNKLRAAPTSTDKKSKPKQNTLLNVLENAIDQRRIGSRMDERDNSEEENLIWEDDQPFDANKIVGTDKDKDKEKKKDKKEKPVKEKSERKKREKEEKEAREKEEEERLKTLEDKYAPLLKSAKNRQEYDKIIDEFNKQKVNEQPGQESFKEVQKAKLKEFEEAERGQKAKEKLEKKAAQEKKFKELEDRYKPKIQSAATIEEYDKIVDEYENEKKALNKKAEKDLSLEELRKVKLQEFEEQRKQQKIAERENQEQEAQLERNKEVNQSELGKFGKIAENRLATEGYKEYPMWYTVNYGALMQNRDILTPDEFKKMIGAALIRLDTRIKEDKETEAKKLEHPHDVQMDDNGESEQALYDRKQEQKEKRTAASKKELTGIASERREKRAEKSRPPKKAYGRKEKDKQKK
jgi:hypothetical protein